MRVLVILLMVALLIPIGFLVTEPRKRRRRSRQRPPVDGPARRTDSDSLIGDIVEAALDARANRRVSSPTYASAAPVQFRASSGRVVSLPHVPAHRHDDAAVERRGDSDGMKAVEAEAVEVEAVESSDDIARAIGDQSDVAPESWEPVDADRLFLGRRGR